MPRRVLVPYDTSEPSEYALEHAISTFESAEIVLLNVVEPFADHTGAGGYADSRFQQQMDQAASMLEDVRERYGSHERIETDVEYGRPIHTILKYIDMEHIDQVVMGSHGRDGATRILLGSVAETVARRSPVPVTVAREPRTGDEEIREVLVPFDGSSMSRRALEHALNRFPGANVTALLVAYPAEEMINGGSPMEVFEDWDQERADYISNILSTAEDVAESMGQSVTTEHVPGEPERAIVEYASDNDVDHIVIGSTGRDGLTRILLGSVAETVVRRAPVSVTVAK